MSNTFNNYGGNYGNQAAGHAAYQHANIDSIAIYRQITSLADRVANEGRLESGRRRER